MKTLHLSASAILAITLSSSLNAQQVPNIFSPDTPAVAAEVNENFAHVTDRLTAVENDSQGGLPIDRFRVDVDCTNNPRALNEAYIENKQYQDIEFLIDGECYGDITIDFTRVNENGNWTGDRTQIHDQIVSVRPKSGSTASIIPHADSGSATLNGVFGGGLYLNDLVITMGEFDSYGALYSRNAQGTVRNTTIVGANNGFDTGIHLQEGAQVYIGPVTISDTNVGVEGLNGAVIRFLGSVTTFNNVNTGIRLSGSVARSSSTLNITAKVNALDFVQGSSLNAVGRTINVFDGTTRMSTNSTLRAQNFVAEVSDMLIFDSVVEIFGSLSLNNLSTTNSRVYAAAGSISEWYNLFDGSKALLFGSEAVPFSIGNMQLVGNSVGSFTNSAISGVVSAASNSAVILTNSTVGSLNIDSANVRGFGVEVTSIEAKNTASIEFDGLSEADSININSSTLTLKNATLSGNVRAYDNSTVHLETSEVNGVEIGKSSSAVITSSTLRGVTSVVDFLEASLWVNKNSAVSTFGTTTFSDGALPVNIEALSFAELGFGGEHVFNGVAVECVTNSIAYIAPNSDVSVSGCVFAGQ